MVEYATFDKLNIQLLAISGNNLFSQKMFAASLDLAYPLLSDYPDLTVIQRYGVLTHIGAPHHPVAEGTYILIDKQGVIRGKWIKPRGVVFPNEPLLKAAQELEP
jgi:peroxiredoxin